MTTPDRISAKGMGARRDIRGGTLHRGWNQNPKTMPTAPFAACAAGH